MLPVIRYRRTRGHVGCAEEQSVLFKAVCGHPIRITAEADYMTLYHVFERLPQARGYRLLRKRVGQNQWDAFAISEVKLAEIPPSTGNAPDI